MKSTVVHTNEDVVGLCNLSDRKLYVRLSVVNVKSKRSYLIFLQKKDSTKINVSPSCLFLVRTDFRLYSIPIC